MTKHDRWSDTIEVLACDIASRPQAPGHDQLRAYVTGVSREPGSVVISYRAEGADLFAAFAAAESVCCSGLRWDLEEADGLTLRISATESQLDALGVLFAEA